MVSQTSTNRLLSGLKKRYIEYFAVRQVDIINRGRITLKHHYVDDRCGHWLWPFLAKEIGIHGGLGDVILLLPFIQDYRRRFPRRKIRVIYTDVRSDRIDRRNFGLGATRLEKGPGNSAVNPIADLLFNISFIDQKIGGDPSQARDYWIPDAAFRQRWGTYLSPQDYRRRLFPEIFTLSDRLAADDFWRQHDLAHRFVVVFHFRRQAQKIAHLYRILRDRLSGQGRLCCIFLGSSRNQILPELAYGEGIDLTDNYSKGVPLRILYQIVMRSQLFIGGRGSFEHFFWLAQVPSINFMDRHALGQDQAFFGTWVPEFWKQNRFPDLVTEDDDPQDITHRLVLPYFEEWKNHRLRLQPIFQPSNAPR